MSRKQIIWFTILVVVVVGAITIYKIWNKPFTDPMDADAIPVTATKLLSDFSTNEADAQKKYVPDKLGNKVVEVTGEIKEAGKNPDGETYYYLKTGDENSGVKCIMDKGAEIKDAKAGDAVKIRGFCDGVKKDSMLDIVMMDVIINRCKPVK